MPTDIGFVKKLHENTELISEEQEIPLEKLPLGPENIILLRSLFYFNNYQIYDI